MLIPQEIRTHKYVCPNFFCNHALPIAQDKFLYLETLKPIILSYLRLLTTITQTGLPVNPKGVDQSAER